MAAALVAVDSKSPPPPDLVMAWHCERWGYLPEGGGLLDQPANMLNRMARAKNAYDAMAAFERVPAGGAAKWAQDNPDMWQIVAQLKGWSKKNG